MFLKNIAVKTVSLVILPQQMKFGGIKVSPCPPIQHAGFDQTWWIVRLYNRDSEEFNFSILAELWMFGLFWI